MQALMTLLMAPLAVLNSFGVIASGVWLAILGEWVGIGWGLLAIMVGAFICAFLLLPGLIAFAPAAWMMEKGGILTMLGYAIGVVGLLWTYIVMSAWGMFSFDFFIARADAGSHIPYLIWAYGVATAPWAYMASKEDNVYAGITVFFLQIAAAVGIFTIGFSQLSSMSIFLVFVSIMLIGFIINVLLGGVGMLVEARAGRKAL